jgi:hypothetical protein
VSEETGHISLAMNGAMESHIDMGSLRDILTELFTTEKKTADRRPASNPEEKKSPCAPPDKKYEPEVLSVLLAVSLWFYVSYRGESEMSIDAPWNSRISRQAWKSFVRTSAR